MQLRHSDLIALLVVVLLWFYLLASQSCRLSRASWIWRPVEQPEARLGQLLVLEGEGLFPFRHLSGLHLRDLDRLLFRALHAEVILQGVSQLLRHRQRLVLANAFHLQARALELDFAEDAHLAPE